MSKGSPCSVCKNPGIDNNVHTCILHLIIKWMRDPKEKVHGNNHSLFVVSDIQRVSEQEMLERPHEVAEQAGGRRDIGSPATSALVLSNTQAHD